MKKHGHTFIIEDVASARSTNADSLTITENGWAKFWLRGKLVGVVKSDSWRRIYIESTKQEPKP